MRVDEVRAGPPEPSSWDPVGSGVGPQPKDPRPGWGGPGGLSAGAPLAAGPRGLRGCGLCFSQEEWPGV